MRNPFTLNRLTSLVSAPVIWSMHFVACYVLVSLACAYGFGGVDTGIALLTIAALAMLAYVALINWRKWNQAQRPSHPGQAPGHELQTEHGAPQLNAFFSLTSMMLCALSAVALIWVAFPAVLLPNCAA